GGNEQWDVVVAVLERELQLDAPEERRVGREHEPVGAGLDVRGERRDPSVAVGVGGGDAVVAAVELDVHAARRPAALDVEDVSGERDAHGANLRAWARCSRAISSSSPRTRRPSRTISSPPT